MKLQELIDKLSLKALTQTEDKEVTGIYISDMLSDVMSSAQAGNLWITVQTHKNIVSAANLIDVSAIIIAHGRSVPPDIIELANRFHVNILSSPASTYDLTARLIEAGIK